MKSTRGNKIARKRPGSGCEADFALQIAHAPPPPSFLVGRVLYIFNIPYKKNRTWFTKSRQVQKLPDVQIQFHCLRKIIRSRKWERKGVTERVSTFYWCRPESLKDLSIQQVKNMNWHWRNRQLAKVLSGFRMGQSAVAKVIVMVAAYFFVEEMNNSCTWT